ncbi:MAG: LysR family transcriptional regulator [Bdellovibrionales bacterium]|nr:LysR family transcriptional regulator [Bdellovibrionales bacterium]
MLFQNFEALAALGEFQTMSRAAARLGVTQPAISKRIRQLEADLGRKLVEPMGRNVVLTPYATMLLERARPLYLQFKEALQEEVSEGTGELTIALSGALLLSWGAKILKKIRQDNPAIKFSFAVHRSPIAIARVRSGECMVAIVHGLSELTPDLDSRYLADEEFVIVPSELKPFGLPRRGGRLSLLTVEAHSETWSALERKLRRWAGKSGVELEVANTLQNFHAVSQLAHAGYGNGLAPIGVPLALGISRSKLVSFPKPGLQIPISLVGRRSTLERGLVVRFFESLRAAIEAQGR